MPSRSTAAPATWPMPPSPATCATPSYSRSAPAPRRFAAGSSRANCSGCAEEGDAMTTPLSAATSTDGYAPDDPFGALPVLPTSVDPSSVEFQANRAAYEEAVALLHERLRAVYAGG